MIQAVMAIATLIQSLVAAVRLYLGHKKDTDDKECKK